MKRDVVIYWAFQDFRNEDRAMDEYDIGELLWMDPLVSGIHEKTGKPIVVRPPEWWENLKMLSQEYRESRKVVMSNE